jgi:sterol desaturase/sphingolipid hydroxylase (fatty acid hydroxylase superfamily)
MLRYVVENFGYLGVLFFFFGMMYFLQEKAMLDEEVTTSICYLLSLFLLLGFERSYPYIPDWNLTEMDSPIDQMPGILFLQIFINLFIKLFFFPFLVLVGCQKYIFLVFNDVFHIISLSANFALAKYLVLSVLSFFNYQSPFAPFLSSLHPIWQVILSVHLGEVGYYFQHRFGHTCSFLWPFHAVHHQVRRVYVLNAGRIHFFDQLLSNLFTFSLHYIVGFNDHSLSYVFGAYTIFGMLSHANVNFKTDFFNFIFNTADIHRWHHSSSVSESNTNYGENLMFLDILLGTYYNPKHSSFRCYLSELFQNSTHPISKIKGYGRTRYREGPGICKKDHGEVFRLPKSIYGQMVRPFTHNPIICYPFIDVLFANPKE